MYNELSGLNQISFNLLSNNVQPTYTNWAPEEPLSEGKCVSMHKKDSSFSKPSFSVGQWMVNKCSFKHNYICKKPVIQTSLTTPSTDPGCPQVNIEI